MSQITPILDPHALAKQLSGKHLIGGEFRPAQSGKTFDVVYPATGAVIAQAARGDAADVDAAVTAAVAAQKDWARLSARQRGKRSEEHTSELQSLMRNSYAGFCL